MTRPPSETDVIAHCPKCGMRVWRKTLESKGCPICRDIDSSRHLVAG